MTAILENYFCVMKFVLLQGILYQVSLSIAYSNQDARGR